MLLLCFGSNLIDEINFLIRTSTITNKLQKIAKNQIFQFRFWYLRFFILESKIIFGKKGNVKKGETYIYHEAD
jgi:hypothetical protein